MGLLSTSVVTQQCTRIVNTSTSALHARIPRAAQKSNGRPPFSSQSQKSLTGHVMLWSIRRCCGRARACEARTVIGRGRLHRAFPGVHRDTEHNTSGSLEKMRTDAGSTCGVRIRRPCVRSSLKQYLWPLARDEGGGRLHRGRARAAVLRGRGRPGRYVCCGHVGTCGAGAARPRRSAALPYGVVWCHQGVLRWPAAPLVARGRWRAAMCPVAYTQHLCSLPLCADDFDQCKTCVFVIERIKKGTNMLLPSICAEIYQKYPDGKAYANVRT
jgi:hypothetical protein